MCVDELFWQIWSHIMFGIHIDLAGIAVLKSFFFGVMIPCTIVSMQLLLQLDLIAYAKTLLVDDCGLNL